MFGKKEYDKKYNRENYFSTSIRITEQDKEMIKRLAKHEGLPINHFFLKAFEEMYSVDLFNEKPRYPTKSKRKENNSSYSVFRVRTEMHNKPIIQNLAKNESLSINQLFIKAFEDVYNVKIN